MKDHTMATFQDVMDKAFGKDLAELTIGLTPAVQAQTCGRILDPVSGSRRR